MINYDLTDDLEFEDFIHDFEENNYANCFIVIGTLDLWDGRRKVFQIFHSIRAVMLHCFEDENEVTINGRGMHIYATHHDGKNAFTVYCSNLTERQQNNFKEIMRRSHGNLTKDQKNHYLRRVRCFYGQYVNANDCYLKD